MDLFKPKGAGQPRRPLDDNTKNGQIINTPRYSRFGGLDSAKKTAENNQMKIVPPGDGKKVI